jgi:hypothetical protein
VRTQGDATPVGGREFLFASLPDPQSAEGRDAYLPAGLAFYRWNVLRKWGSVSVWRDRTLERLQRWGLNTVGIASFDLEMQLQRRVPHIRTLQALDLAAVPRTPSGFPDVFDPRWRAAVERVAAEEAGPSKDNPWILGYIVDERPAWGTMRLLEMPAGTHLRARWSQLLRERHGTPAALAKAWRAPLASWDQVRDATSVPAGGAADLAELETVYAEAYFTTIAAALKKHDPNHLYLGCGLPPAPPANEGIGRVAARSLDVVTVAPEGEVQRAGLDRWHQLTEKPILVGAHQVPLLGPRQISSHAPAFPEAERRRHVVRLLSELAALPYAIGAHWCPYADAPLTGRTGDGANQIVGLVDITDRPHEDLVAAARDVSARLYELHAGKQ